MSNRRFEEIARMTNRDDESIKREVIISYNKETEKYQIVQDEIKTRNGEATRYHMGPAICLTEEQLTNLFDIIGEIKFDIANGDPHWLTKDKQ